MSFCRDCLADAPETATRCPACGSPRLARHPELERLTIAHVDCDAFYATIEKRDDPSLIDKPVIVGGGKRGVVAACCYMARTYGIRSAMPMFEAKRRCPQAVVIKPNMAKYVQSRARSAPRHAGADAAGRAAVDRRGLSRFDRHRAAARHERGQRAGAFRARRWNATLASRFRSGCRPTSSSPRSPPTWTSRAASPCSAQDEAAAFLAPKPVGFIYGVGARERGQARRRRLSPDRRPAARREHDLMRRYGEEGARLWRLARGIDTRAVDPERDTKSISAETTFERDIGEFRPLEQQLWDLTERVSARLKANALAGSTVTSKLKSADFKIRTRARALGHPTQLAARIFAAGRDLLAHEVGTTRFRLIGIGVSHLEEAAGDDLADLDRPPRGRSRARGRPPAREIRPRRGGEGPGAGRGLAHDPEKREPVSRIRSWQIKARLGQGLASSGRATSFRP